ncbi:MAG: mechanosensitive ion channel family protein [Rhodoferax sp.]
MFRQLIANNTLQDWAYALLAACTFIVLMNLLRRVVLHHLERVSRQTDTVIDDFFVDVLGATRILLASALGLYLGSHFLTLPEPVGKWVQRAFGVALIIQIGFWSARALVFWLRHHFSRGEEDDAGSRTMTLSLLSFLGRTVIWLLVLLFTLDNLGVNVTALVASLGIGGIAVALAVQNILGDLFASLSIAIDKPFVIGDFIVLGQEMGTVEHVGLKTTRLRSLSGEQIIMSNNDLLQARIHNYKRMTERRIVFALGVTYDTPADTLALIPSLVEAAVKTEPKARFDRAHFKGFGAFSLDFEVVYFVTEADYKLYMDVQQGINLKMVRTFAEHRIEFAFPTQTLHLNHSAIPGLTAASTGTSTPPTISLPA